MIFSSKIIIINLLCILNNADFNIIDFSVKNKFIDKLYSC